MATQHKQYTITTITSVASLYQTRRPTEGRAATQHNTMYNNNNNNSVSKSTPTLNYTVTKAAPSLQYDQERGPEDVFFRQISLNAPFR
mmetsp:Transcript_22221/g.23765  ORF Transcript_22221/g.23765 Transcript_22221/m.23765 type:complete len:88 (+) Transcript_22221:41-304(+)